jgi:hypothetical protein
VATGLLARDATAPKVFTQISLYNLIAFAPMLVECVHQAAVAL